MKLNYLSIALATALATTLTACGSDNSSNYNQPTVSPAPQTKPDAGAKPGNDAGTNKPGTDAGTNKPAEDNKKPEGDANKKPDGDADADKKPEGDANKKPEGDAGKKPETEAKPDEKINPGNAANPGNIETDNFVVAQNYIRGAASNFDKDNNPDKIGNASAIGFNELNNPYMSNIILARFTDGNNKVTNIYAGEQPENVNSSYYQDNGTIGNEKGTTALQNLNDTQFIKRYDAAAAKATAFVALAQANIAADTLAKAAQKNNSSNEAKKAASYAKTAVAAAVAALAATDAATDAATVKKAAADADAAAKVAAEAYAYSKTNDKVDADAAAAEIAAIKKAAIKKYYESIYQSGLVLAKNDGKGKGIVRGQENPVIKEIKDGKFVVTSRTGAPTEASKNDVRMFGSLSQISDVPARRWNATTQEFEKNPGYNKDAQTQNAWRFDVEGRKKAIQNLVKTKQTDKLSSDTVMLPDALHLDHVQYGRVTANTDAGAIEQLAKSYKDGANFHQFSTINKVNESNKQSVEEFNKTDTAIDYYFARGLEPTKNDKMPTEGTVKYLGHALTYGLDNSFHGGNNDNNKTNTAVITPRDAVGNFVEATLDTATKQVNGSIYNVWSVDSDNLIKGVVKDNLVTFSGDVQGNTNSVLGTAKLAYTAAANTPTEASFRGGFFGDNASELAGNINTTKEGYGNTAWGAVFGAKAVVAESKPTGPSIENQVEAKKETAAAPAAN